LSFLPQVGSSKEVCKLIQEIADFSLVQDQIET
jgi:hypothetical protein